MLPDQRTVADETIRVADRWYVLATSSRTDDRTRVLKDGDMFAVFDRFGDVHPIGTGELGIYYEGTRFLSYFDLRLNGRRPMLLNSSVKQDNSLLTVDLTTPDFREEGTLSVLKGTVHVFRAILLWQAVCHQHLRIVNYNAHAVALELSLAFGADYADIFEVRGFVRQRRGTDAPARTHDHGVILGYQGLDGVRRRTGIRCTPAPTLVAADRIAYALTLPPRGRTEIDIAIGCELDEVRVGVVVFSVRHDTAEVADPLALEIQVLERARMPRREVGSDGLKLADRLRLARGARVIHGERPSAPLALGHVGHLPDADVGVEPVGMVRSQL